MNPCALQASLTTPSVGRPTASWSTDCLLEFFLVNCLFNDCMQEIVRMGLFRGVQSVTLSGRRVPDFNEFLLDLTYQSSSSGRTTCQRPKNTSRYFRARPPEPDTTLTEILFTTPSYGTRTNNRTPKNTLKCMWRRILGVAQLEGEKVGVRSIRLRVTTPCQVPSTAPCWRKHHTCSSTDTQSREREGGGGEKRGASV